MIFSNFTHKCRSLSENALMAKQFRIISQGVDNEQTKIFNQLPHPPKAAIILSSAGTL